MKAEQEAAEPFDLEPYRVDFDHPDFQLVEPEPLPPKPWSTYLLALAVLLAVRLAAASVNIVHDCDEVFNYWEPLHRVVHGTGLQTWEYSAEFGLRSYLYIYLHAWAAVPGGALVQALRAATGMAALPARAAEFYAVRGLLALVSSLADAWLFSVTERAAGSIAGCMFVLQAAFSAGMLAQTTALLPSSLVCAALAASVAAAIDMYPRRAVVLASAGCIAACWPFAGIACVWIGLWGCVNLEIRPCVAWTVGAACVVMAVGALIDKQHYDRWLCAPLNLVKYNFAGGDSTLYGVEPFYFYLKNIFLNFSTVAWAAFCGAPISTFYVCTTGAFEWSIWPRAVWLSWTSTWTWFGVLSLLPHKEERFFTPVYSLMVLYSALGWESLRRCLGSVGHRAAWVATLVAVALGLLRFAALCSNYGAPIAVYSALPEARHGSEVLCVGDEWHRFPSSFFLPEGYEVAWVRESGGGMLPMPWDDSDVAPAHFNDRNEESPAQYVPLRKCTLLVDAKPRGDSGLAGKAGGRWVTLAEADFVDQPASSFLPRVLWVPRWLQEATGMRNTYLSYTLKRRL